MAEQFTMCQLTEPLTLYKDVARLIALNITDSLSYARFTQVCRASRDICTELLSETQNTFGSDFIYYLPSSQKTIRHGYFEFYHDKWFNAKQCRTMSRRLEKTGYYKDNKYHSTIKKYDHTGCFVVELFKYQNGLLHGTVYKYSIYHPGEVIYKCEYTNGKKHGREWKKGKGAHGQTWKINNQGRAVYTFQYDKNGVAIISGEEHRTSRGAYSRFQQPEYKELLAFGGGAT